MDPLEKLSYSAVVLVVGTLLAILLYQILAPLIANPDSPDFGNTTGGLFCLTCPVSYAIVGLAIFGYTKLATHADKEEKG